MTPDRWQRIKPVLDAALDRTGADRAALLDAACADDAGLRREVESILTAADGTGILDVPAPLLGLTLGPSRPATALTPGTRLGPYEIVAFLSRGGMGDVYRARDPRLGRDVALKVVTVDTRTDAERRFAEEARAASALNHPNIVTVFDVGAEGGLHYVVTELLEGRTLRARLVAGPMPLAEVLPLARQGAEGLAAAHDRGIVHRDLKPENLFVTAESRLKILDFGLAQVTRRPAPVVAPVPEGPFRATARGRLLGTVEYMSPEQVRGAAPSPASDVFSFGLVLYEMLAGRPAFAGDTTPEVVSGILRDAPPPLPEGVLAAAPGLDAVVRRCLAKDPADRYPSARELAGALTGDLEGRLPDPRRRRAARVVGAALALAVGATLVVRSGPWSSPALELETRDFILVGDFDNQTGNPLFDRALRTALTASLAESRLANVLSEARIEDALARMRRDRGARQDAQAAREVCLREGARAFVTGSIVRVGDRYVLGGRVVDPKTGDAVRSFEEPAAGEDDVLPALSRLATRVRRSLGESFSAIREDGRSMPPFTTASLRALDLYARGRVQWFQGRFDEAVRTYEAAVELDPEFAMAHAALGSAHFSVFYDPAKGKAHFEKALGSPITDRERLWIRASYESGRGRFPHAETLYRRYVADHPDDPRARFGFGNLLWRTRRRFGEAIEQFEAAARIDPRDPPPHVRIGASHLAAGDPVRAVSAYERAFAIDAGAVHWLNAGSEYGLALALSGRPDRARETFDLALRRPDRRGRGLRSHSVLDVFEGRYRSAASRLAEAARLHRGSPAEASRDLLLLALVHEAEGRGDRARPPFEEAWRALEALPFDVPLVHAAAASARAGRLDRTVQVRDRIRREADPESAEDMGFLHRLDGELELARGRPAAALEWFRIADDLVPTLFTAEALARGYARAGDQPRARAAYETFVGMTSWPLCDEVYVLPAWLEAHYELALLHRQRGDLEAARRFNDALLRSWSEADTETPLLRRALKLRQELAPAAVSSSDLLWPGTWPRGDAAGRPVRGR
jgi:serine/threonine protein kinase/tetratricopeptide (TPR) repeat protein